MSGNNGLILPRHQGQKVHLFTELGQEIIVTLLGLNYNGEARLSFVAGYEIRIIRGEIIGMAPVLKNVVGIDADENRGNR